MQVTDFFSLQFLLTFNIIGESHICGPWSIAHFCSMVFILPFSAPFYLPVSHSFHFPFFFPFNYYIVCHCYSRKLSWFFTFSTLLHDPLFHFFSQTALMLFWKLAVLSTMKPRRGWGSTSTPVGGAWTQGRHTEPSEEEILKLMPCSERRDCSLVDFFTHYQCLWRVSMNSTDPSNPGSKRSVKYMIVIYLPIISFFVGSNIMTHYNLESRTIF